MRRLLHPAILLAVLASASGCPRTADSTQDAGPLASAVASSSSSSTPAAPPSSSAEPLAAVTWKGTYKSVAGSVTIPPSLKAGSWANADTQAALGDGALTLVVEPRSGRVTGALEGPLGPASVAGLSADGKLTATIRRIDPSDEGFTGTLEAEVKDAKLEGTMNGALGRANAVRTATFTMTSGGNPAGGAH
jgi:hypothetical protein